ncbi:MULTISPECIES: hypothetical protein [Moraxella]|uniref:Uncharacterized protein n=2 Tax=Moraxella lacunata TaxID=477 RepID=A0A1B8PUX7_MORLA|nr:MULTISPECIES: hypothetical protein [Moraxella]MBE9579885.1 hypothetical protein [Moraxella sp. K1664]MBE9589222.1 hypothetical protein [Moraxella sp. K1630]MBE9590922.1 hypothetical protein [Moraxella sp. K127]MBE9597475.1 hypothetical protein [Moraxella sp. K2450]MDH9220010.1 hypothetical protein [Moraxella lacunata]
MGMETNIKHIINLLNNENSSAVYGTSIFIFCIGIGLLMFLYGIEIIIFIVFAPLILCLKNLFSNNGFIGVICLGLYLYPLLLLVGLSESSYLKENDGRKYSFAISVIFTIVLMLVFLEYFKEFIGVYYAKTPKELYYHFYYFILYSLVIPPIYEIYNEYFGQIKYYYFILLFFVFYFLIF